MCAKTYFIALQPTATTSPPPPFVDAISRNIITYTRRTGVGDRARNGAARRSHENDRSTDRFRRLRNPAGLDGRSVVRWHLHWRRRPHTVMRTTRAQFTRQLNATHHHHRRRRRRRLVSDNQSCAIRAREIRIGQALHSGSNTNCATHSHIVDGNHASLERHYYKHPFGFLCACVRALTCAHRPPNASGGTARMMMNAKAIARTEIMV